MSQKIGVSVFLLSVMLLAGCATRVSYEHMGQRRMTLEEHAEYVDKAKAKISPSTWQNYEKFKSPRDEFPKNWDSRANLYRRAKEKVGSRITADPSFAEADFLNEDIAAIDEVCKTLDTSVKNAPRLSGDDARRLYSARRMLRDSTKTACGLADDFRAVRKEFADAKPKFIKLMDSFASSNAKTFFKGISKACRKAGMLDHPKCKSLEDPDKTKCTETCFKASEATRQTAIRKPLKKCIKYDVEKADDEAIEMNCQIKVSRYQRLTENAKQLVVKTCKDTCAKQRAENRVLAERLWTASTKAIALCKKKKEGCDDVLKYLELGGKTHRKTAKKLEKAFQVAEEKRIRKAEAAAERERKREERVSKCVRKSCPLSLQQCMAYDELSYNRWTGRWSVSRRCQKYMSCRSRDQFKVIKCGQRKYQSCLRRCGRR
ncbi:MAG: hypothetical protein ACON3Z_04670 [Bradymonadia bacterium]